MELILWGVGGIFVGLVLGAVILVAVLRRIGDHGPGTWNTTRKL